MSISSMTNVAFARRADVPPVDEAPKTDAEIVAATAGTAESRSVSSQMQVIVTYIPTEVLTLYVAVLAAIPNLRRDSFQPGWIAFGAFAACTPVVVWLSYAAKVRAANKALPLSPSKWPLWEMSAATLAYAAWAFALPNSPFQYFSGSWYSSAIAGVVILTTSTFLGLIAPIVQRPLPP
jgi:hypothetical protein